MKKQGQSQDRAAGQVAKKPRQAARPTGGVLAGASRGRSAGPSARPSARPTARRAQGQRRPAQGQWPTQTAANPGRVGHVLTSLWLSEQAQQAEQERQKRDFPRWLIPLLIFIILLGLVFVWRPYNLQQARRAELEAAQQKAGALANAQDSQPLVADGLNPGQGAAHEAGPSPEQGQGLYEKGQYAVTTESVVDVFDQPDIRANRIDQILYNTPVRLQPEGTTAMGFTAITLSDGATAYVESRKLTMDKRSVEPLNFKGRLVVATLSKTIYSHPQGGNSLMDVKLGTTLFYRYHYQDLYQVALPNGGEGWVSASGLLQLGVTDPITDTDGQRFADTLQGFVGATYLKNGVSDLGASIPGIVQQAARINGLDLPHGIAAMQKLVPEVQGWKNDNGSINYTRLQPGDLLFLIPKLKQPKPEIQPASNMAVWMDYGIVLADREDAFVVSEMKLEDYLGEQWSLQSVGRPFVQ